MNQASIDSLGVSKGSLKSYLTGLALALILTGISFGLVMSGILSTWGTLLAIFIAAFVQILVHLYYFLHVDASVEARWNVWALLYTVFIMALFVGGGLWIMYNLHWRMAWHG
jgi:cytochrome o ubiquinol oxidase operon protein cyoD